MRDAARVEFEWVFRSAYPRCSGRCSWCCRTAAEPRRYSGRVRPAVRTLARGRRHRPSGGLGAAGGGPGGDQAGEARTGRCGWSPWSTRPGRGPAPGRRPRPCGRVAAAQQRAAVALFYLEDRPVDEVAQLLGVSTSTAKQHLFRARSGWPSCWPDNGGGARRCRLRATADRPVRQHRAPGARPRPGARHGRECAAGRRRVRMLGSACRRRGGRGRRVWLPGVADSIRADDEALPRSPGHRRPPTRCGCWTRSAEVPTTRPRWRPVATRSPSSGRLTTHRGGRSRCRPVGGRTGCSWRRARTWTRTYGGSSCSR